MAMSKDHRERLRCNRVRILEDLEINEELFSLLRQKKILTEDMQEVIEAEKTRTTKAGKLLDTLVRRGQYAFESFIEALCLTSQEELAELLDAHLCGKYGKPDEIMPIIALTNQHFIAEIEKVDFVVKVNQMHSSFKQKLCSDSLVYSCNESSGRAFILGNEKDDSGSLGIDADLKNLISLLEQLRFKIEFKLNLTSSEIEHELREEAKRQNIETSVFVLCILNYGNKYDEIYGKDRRPVKIENIVSLFDGNHCHALLGKPKLFIIHTGEPDLGPSFADNGPGQPFTTEEGTCTTDGSIFQTDVTVCHEKADVVRLLSTSDDVRICLQDSLLFDDVSVWRCKEKGSWFIRCLTSVISCSAERHHIEEMIAKVIAIAKQLKDDGRPLTIPEKKTTLRKSFYFMP